MWSEQIIIIIIIMIIIIIIISDLQIGRPIILSHRPPNQCAMAVRFRFFGRVITVVAVLVLMMEILIEELSAVGLHLNTSKTKILTTTALTDRMFVDVGGDMIEVVHGQETQIFREKTPWRFEHEGNGRCET